MLHEGSSQEMTGINQNLIETLFASTQHVSVKQKVELFEMITGFETKNKYQLEFGSGEKAMAFEGKRPKS